MLSKPIKICIVVISLGKGGLERTTAFLSRMLFDEGYDVHIVVLKDGIDYEYKGELLNLGLLKDKKDSAFSRWKRFKIFKDYIDENNFNYIIDARSKQEPIVELLYLFYVYRKTKKIYIVHNFKTELYFTRLKWIARLIGRNVDKIVCVSRAIQKRVGMFCEIQKTETIYNPIEIVLPDIPKIDQELPLKYILFLGRVEDGHKNLKLLIDSYEISDFQANSIKLLIVGDGSDKENIQAYIQEKGLSDSIIMKPFTPSIHNYLSNALFLVLTSRYEGFPMVLIESLSVGIPVVSVDCESGPNEIVKNEYNGLLVENNNPQKFAEAMNRMITDCKLYSFCKSNTKDSIQHLSQRKIMEQWKSILV